MKLDEVLENLNTQMKQTEANFHKLQGAIEIITSLKEEEKKEAKASKRKVKAK